MSTKERESVCVCVLGCFREREPTEKTKNSPVPMVQKSSFSLQKLTLNHFEQINLKRTKAGVDVDAQPISRLLERSFNSRDFFFIGIVSASKSLFFLFLPGKTIHFKLEKLDSVRTRLETSKFFFKIKLELLFYWPPTLTKQ